METSVKAEFLTGQSLRRRGEVPCHPKAERSAALGRLIVSRKGAKAQRKGMGKKEKAGKTRLELAILSETCKHPTAPKGRNTIAQGSSAAPPWGTRSPRHSSP
jgi:hypothetical protein